VASPVASLSSGGASPGGDGLAVGRSTPSASGSSFSGPLTAEPEVMTHTLAADDEFLLLGCDGECTACAVTFFEW
jgi:serine/threonine protein phosphatase PrpC